MNSYIDGLIKVELPEGFKELSEDEILEYEYIYEPPSAVFRNDEKHIMISVGTEQTKGILGGIAGSKDIAKGNEKKLKKAMKEYGYSRDCFYRRPVSGEKADCFRYTYTADDTRMSGDSICMKRGKTLIYVHAYYRTDMQQDRIEALDEFLSGFKIY